jgi:hypothetical protein
MVQLPFLTVISARYVQPIEIMVRCTNVRLKNKTNTHKYFLLSLADNSVNNDPCNQQGNDNPTMVEVEEIDNTLQMIEKTENTNLVSLTSFSSIISQAVETSTGGTGGGWNQLDKSKFIASNDSKERLVGNKQYGRALPPLVQQMVEITKLAQSDKFVDVGSGCGQVIFQVAATVGCVCSGVEVVEGRHFAAEQLREHLINELIDKCSKEVEVEGGKLTPPDILYLLNPPRCNLVNASFTDQIGADMLTSADVLFVNNAEGIFSAQRSEKGGKDLDSELAKIVRK